MKYITKVRWNNIIQHKGIAKQLKNSNDLEQRCSLPFLVSTDLKMLAPLDRVLRDVLATLALKPQHNLLGGFCLLVEHGLGLATIP